MPMGGRRKEPSLGATLPIFHTTPPEVVRYCLGVLPVLQPCSLHRSCQFQLVLHVYWASCGARGKNISRLHEKPGLAAIGLKQYRGEVDKKSEQSAWKSRTLSGKMSKKLEGGGVRACIIASIAGVREEWSNIVSSSTAREYMARSATGCMHPSPHPRASWTSCRSKCDSSRPTAPTSCPPLHGTASALCGRVLLSVLCFLLHSNFSGQVLTIMQS